MRFAIHWVYVKFACAGTYALTPADMAEGLNAFRGTSIDAAGITVDGRADRELGAALSNALWIYGRMTACLGAF